MRQRVRYVSGGSPTRLANFAANAERDIATREASDSTVHGSAGCSCTSASGAGDLVAYGASFLANPDLPRRFRERAR